MLSASRTRLHPTLTLLVTLLHLALHPLQASDTTTLLLAGTARTSINPLEENIPATLGGYGAREGKPAEGTLDTIFGKILLLEHAGEKTALISLDTCSTPICLAQETLAKANIPGLHLDRTLIMASHTHAGLEGFSLDRRNVANNPHIGVFSEPMLKFVTDRLAHALQQADLNLQPVLAASGVVPLPQRHRNRRDTPFIDPHATILRLDHAQTREPIAILVNYAAHGTFVDETDMLISSEWPGSMQRTIEDLYGNNILCLYANGAEGDIAPQGRSGGSHYEQAQNYGRQIGIAIWQETRELTPIPVSQFITAAAWITLPPRQGAPDFIKIAGAEYHVTEAELNELLQVLLPPTAPSYALRINGFGLLSLPGEPICELGLTIKSYLQKNGIQHPAVLGLTTDYIGYMLTPEEYQRGGYEVTASFYGPTLGPTLLNETQKLAAKLSAHHGAHLHRIDSSTLLGCDAHQ
jgi:hypothetical protein